MRRKQFLLVMWYLSEGSCVHIVIESLRVVATGISKSSVDIHKRVFLRTFLKLLSKFPKARNELTNRIDPEKPFYRLRSKQAEGDRDRSDEWYGGKNDIQMDFTDPDP